MFANLINDYAFTNMNVYKDINIEKVLHQFNKLHSEGSILAQLFYQ